MQRLVFLLGAVLAEEAAKSPIAEVLQLMKDLIKTAESDQTKEATSYTKTANFCFGQTNKHSSNIDDFSIKIKKQRAKYDGKIAEEESEAIKSKKAAESKAQASQELVDETAAHKEAVAIWTEVEADLTGAVEACTGAIEALTTGGFKGKGFLQEREQQMIALAQLQQTPKEGYNFQSDAIVKSIKEMKKEFEAKKKVKTSEETRRKAAYNTASTSLTKKIKAQGDAKTNADKAKTSAQEDAAAAKKKLSEHAEELQESKRFLSELEQKCTDAANINDQRSKMSADELTMLKQVETVLKDTVKPNTESYKRSLLQVSPEEEPLEEQRKMDDLDAEDLADHSNALTNAEVAVDESDMMDLDDDMRGTEDFSFLQVSSKRSTVATILRSLGHSAEAQQVMGDPLKNVKRMIEKMINTLQDESTAEAEKQGDCTTKISKYTHDSDNSWSDLVSAWTEFDKMQATVASLTEEIKNWKEETKNAKADLKTATQNRKEDKKTNEGIIADSVKGLAGIQKAIKIVEDFYAKSGAQAANLLQVPVEEVADEQGVTFQEKKYGGKQSAASGIVRMFRVLEEDFTRALDKTRDAERQAAEDFQALSVDFNKLITSNTNWREQSETKVDDLNVKMIDSHTSADIANTKNVKAVDKLKALEAYCSDTGMTAEERITAREAEIKSLKEAIKILQDGN